LSRTDKAARPKFEQAERFVDEVLQHACRRLILWSLSIDPDSVTPHPAIGRVQVEAPNRVLRELLLRGAFSMYGIAEEVIDADAHALPEMLDQVAR
jgi:hypothetical protein